jgi:hypothetical protein
VLKSRLFVITLTLVIFTMAELAVGATWIGANGPSVETPVAAEITNRTPASFEVTITFPGVAVENIDTPNGTFTRLTVEAAGVTTDIGAPELPVVRFALWIPEGGVPTLDIISQQSVDISLPARGVTVPVYPVQAPVEKIPGALENAEFRIDHSVYAIDSYQFTQTATLGEPGYLRGYRMVEVEVHPVDYNPVANQLRMVPQLVLRVTIPNANPVATDAMMSRYSSQPYHQMARSMFLNGNELDDIPDLPIGYLIITDTIYETDPNLLDFVAWKHSKGYNTTLVTTATTGASNTQIKTFIQNAYNTWTIPPTYVLFIGDAEDIPNWIGIGADSPPTDLNYAMLSGSDYFPDVYIGRWPVITPAQLGYIIDKTENFEQVLWTGNDTWEKYITFMASNDNYTVS